MGDAVGCLLGLAVGSKVTGLAVGFFVGLTVGDDVGEESQTVSSYVAPERVGSMQSATLGLKKPINFKSGRIDTSIPSHTYDRTVLLASPC